jgi:hypothetical protein
MLRFSSTVGLGWGDYGGAIRVRGMSLYWTWGEYRRAG